MLSRLALALSNDFWDDRLLSFGLLLGTGFVLLEQGVSRCDCRFLAGNPGRQVARIQLDQEVSFLDFVALGHLDVGDFGRSLGLEANLGLGGDGAGDRHHFHHRPMVNLDRFVGDFRASRLIYNEADHGEDYHCDNNDGFFA